MNLAEYQRLRREIQEDCQRDLEALDRIWARFSMKKRPDQDHPEPTGVVKVRLGEINFTDAVRKATRAISGDFTVDTISDYINKNQLALHCDRNKILFTLFRMAKKTHELEVVKPGKSRTPTVYRIKHKD